MIFNYSLTNIRNIYLKKIIFQLCRIQPKPVRNVYRVVRHEYRSSVFVYLWVKTFTYRNKQLTVKVKFTKQYIFIPFTWDLAYVRCWSFSAYWTTTIPEGIWLSLLLLFYFWGSSFMFSKAFLDSTMFYFDRSNLARSK